MKNVAFLIVFGLISNLAQAATPTKIQVVKITDDALTVFGMRLNQNVDKKMYPQAHDADFECNPMDGDYSIVLCEDDYCMPGENVFYELDGPTNCMALQSDLKKMIRKTGSACLTIKNEKSPYGGTVSRLNLGLGSLCR